MLKDWEAYQMLVPLTDAVTRISIFRQEEVDRLIELVKDFCRGDRATEACLTQFIEAARRLED